MSNNNPAHITLTNCRLSYVHLDKPFAQQEGQEPKYSAVILVPKSDAGNKARIDAAIAAAAQRGLEKFGKAFPANPGSSVHDGDGVRSSSRQPYSDECKGHWVFTASNRSPVTVVDTAMQPIINPSDIYSGIYAHVGVTFFPFAHPQNKGIGAALDNVMKISDGEPLGGSRPTAENDFAGLAQAYNPADAFAALTGGVPD